MKTLLFSLFVSFLFFNACHATLAGGWQPIKDANDPKIQKIAEFAVSTHDKQKGASLKLIKVVSGQQQVVAGINFQLLLDAELSTGVVKKFKAVVFESVNDKLKLISFVEAIDIDTLVGGWQPIKDTSDPKIQKIAEFAVSTHDKQKGASLKLIKVVSGQQQVVAGINFQLLLDAELSTGVVKKFKAVVFESMNDKLKLISFVEAIDIDSLAGGWQPIKDASDPKIQKIAEFAVSTHDKQKRASLKLIKVVRGQQQVVAGINFRLLLDAELSTGVVKKFKAVVFESVNDKLKLISFVEAIDIDN